MKPYLLALLVLSLVLGEAAQASDSQPVSVIDPYHLKLRHGVTMADVRRLAEGVTLGELSFQPERECRKPPKAPPDRLLKKRYNPRLLPNLAAQSDDIERYIHRIDLNGDGICDWLREDAEPTKYDSGSVDPRDFLFLGTPDGWRYPGLSEDVRRSLEQAAKAAGSKDGRSFNKPLKRRNPGFLKTLTAFIFEKNNPRPFVVVYQILDGRERFIELSEYTTHRWNDDLDNFDKVPLNQHAAMLVFLHNKLCGKEPPNIMPNHNLKRFTYPIPNEGTLCKEEDASAKK